MIAQAHLMDTSWSERVPEVGGVSLVSSQTERGEGRNWERGKEIQRDGDEKVGETDGERLADVGQGQGSEARYLRAGRRGPGRGAPGSPAQARRRSGRSTGGGLEGGGGGNPPPTRNCLLALGAGGGVRRERRGRGQTLSHFFSPPTPPLSRPRPDAALPIDPAPPLTKAAVVAGKPISGGGGVGKRRGRWGR